MFLKSIIKILMSIETQWYCFLIKKLTEQLRIIGFLSFCIIFYNYDIIFYNSMTLAMVENTQYRR